MMVMSNIVVDMMFIPSYATITTPHFMIMLMLMLMVTMIMVLKLLNDFNDLIFIFFIHLYVDGNIFLDMSVDENVHVIDVDPHTTASFRGFYGIKRKIRGW